MVSIYCVTFYLHKIKNSKSDEVKCVHGRASSVNISATNIIKRAKSKIFNTEFPTPRNRTYLVDAFDPMILNMID